mmetsp:Transcript_3361/g.5806  ORF Transcript_3361/g.5806 Transcript_3361/m.5806 type:complete len:1580 (+) Transcript_3361:83-4822(+)
MEPIVENANVSDLSPEIIAVQPTNEEAPMPAEVRHDGGDGQGCTTGERVESMAAASQLRELPRDQVPNALGLGIPMNSDSGLAGVQASLAFLRGGLAPVCADLPSTDSLALCLELRGAESLKESVGKSRAPADVVLVIDTSYSMQGSIPDVQETVRQVFNALDETDRLAVVKFSSTAKMVRALAPRSDVDDVETTCAQIYVDGQTNIEAGLTLGFQMFDHLQQLGATDSQACTQMSCRHQMMMILSDGLPNCGLTSTESLCSLVGNLCQQCSGGIVVHALGFTAGHSIAVMSALPGAGSGAGKYYYLGTDFDIPASVGDCLGNIVAHACSDIRISISVSEMGSEGWTSDGCHIYHTAGSTKSPLPILGLQPVDDYCLGELNRDERQSFLTMLPCSTKRIRVQLHWQSDMGQQEMEKILNIGDATKDSICLQQAVFPKRLEAVAVAAHVLRLQVAAALIALAVGDISDDRYDPLHEAVHACLTILEEFTETSDVIFLEGMLQSLERDLGEALGDVRNRGSHDRERQGVLLSFAQEHLAMRSASSLTRCRTTYASRKQIQLRLRFLVSAAMAKTTTTPKAELALLQDGLSETELECRRALEDQHCFVSLGGWRECVLGLGLFVHPRRLIDRRKGRAPEVDLVVDYVSAEAYNLGVSTTVQHLSAESELDEDHGEDEGFGESQTPLTSSSRRRINAWLPLYINATNWQTASTFAPSAFSLIATQLNSVFQPHDALKVCARLMCCAVVGFVRPGEGNVGPGGQQRGCLSHRAIQMYCDVHRLFLKMAETYPQIKACALKDIKEFIEKPEKRTRRQTPDLGTLIAYLNILDEVSWDDLAPVFVPEMVRRAFARFTEPLVPERCATMEELITRFDALEPEHGLVILFNKIFNTLVARPTVPWDEHVPDNHSVNGKALSSQKVCEMYDRCWGQLPPKRCDLVFAEAKRIQEIASVADVLQELLPFQHSRMETCELMLWAAKHGASNKPIDDVPDLRDMKLRLTQELQKTMEQKRKLEADVIQNIERGFSRADCFQMLLHHTTILAKSCKVTSSGNNGSYRFASREEACAFATRCRERAVEEIVARAKAAGKKPPSSISATGELAPQDLQAAEKVANSYTDAFPLEIVLRQDVEANACASRFLMAVKYRQQCGRLTTGKDIREKIETLTSLDARRLRIMMHGACKAEIWQPSEFKQECRDVEDTLQDDEDEEDDEHSPLYIKKRRPVPFTMPPCLAVAQQTPKCSSQTEDKADDVSTEEGAQCTFLSNSSPVALWQLHSGCAPQVLSVGWKVRGGKKPGNGWHKSRQRGGKTYTMDIGAAIVRETTFAGIDQHCVAVEDKKHVGVLLGLFELLSCSTSVIICAGGSLRPLQHELLGAGAKLEAVTDSEGSTRCLTIGSSQVHLVEERSVPRSEPGTELVSGEPEFVPLEEFTVEVPQVVKGAGLVVVWGPLQEAASLAQVLWAVRGGPAKGSCSPQVWHLLLDYVPVLVESEEERSAVLDALPQGSRKLNKELQLSGYPAAQVVPSGSCLLGPEKDLATVTLPAMLNFGLRNVRRGFVVRLQQRLGLQVPEVSYRALAKILGLAEGD